MIRSGHLFCVSSRLRASEKTRNPIIFSIKSWVTEIFLHFSFSSYHQMICTNHSSKKVKLYLRDLRTVLWVTFDELFSDKQIFFNLEKIDLLNLGIQLGKRSVFLKPSRLFETDEKESISIIEICLKTNHALIKHGSSKIYEKRSLNEIVSDKTIIRKLKRVAVFRIGYYYGYNQ